MLLMEQIQADSMSALKEGKKLDRRVLSTLVSNLKNKALEKKIAVLEDSDTLQTVQKFLKSLEDEINAFRTAGRTEKVTELTYQYNLVKGYLPKMLSEEEIKDIINILDDKSIKKVMLYFKINYQGKVDMSLVSKVARNIN